MKIRLHRKTGRDETVWENNLRTEGLFLVGMRLLFFIFLLVMAIPPVLAQPKNLTYTQGAIIRGDSTKKELALVFTADGTGEGLPQIRKTLKAESLKAAFFFTGRFYRNQGFRHQVRQLAKEGHYLGVHSDQHLLYCDWNQRDSLLVSRDSFEKDMAANLEALRNLHLPLHRLQLFIPPFEWWNDSISAWSHGQKLRIFNFTPGIRTNTDYTWPEMGTTYKSSEWILTWLKETLRHEPNKLNGAILLLHAGTDPRRKDKFYNRLKELIALLKTNGFVFKRVDALLEQ